MEIKSAEFKTSSVDVKKCPAPNLPEYAFIGRSNVGKSSLINMLTGRKGLAKTSAKPGKTQLINHFIINDEWYLVDLPGYGYAKAPKVMQRKWSGFISDYLLHRENLLCTFVLIDSRHEPQEIDMDFMEWLGEKQIPFVMVFTKTDKSGKVELAKRLAAYKNEMLKYWEELPQIFITSAEKRQGKGEVLEFIEKTNRVFSFPPRKSS